MFSFYFRPKYQLNPDAPTFHMPEKVSQMYHLLKQFLGGFRITINTKYIKIGTPAFSTIAFAHKLFSTKTNHITQLVVNFNC